MVGIYLDMRHDGKEVVGSILNLKINPMIEGSPNVLAFAAPLTLGVVLKRDCIILPWPHGELRLYMGLCVEYSVN